MYGHLFIGLKEYIESEFDIDTLNSILQESGADSSNHKILNNYPDQEFITIIEILSKTSSKPVPETLESFGKYMAHFFTRMYNVFFNKDWQFIDLMEHIEDTMHRKLRIYNPGLNPPELICTRKSSSEVTIMYNSPRRLCDFAIGLIKGFAEHYKENISVTKESCILNQDSVCTISINVLK